MNKKVAGIAAAIFLAGGLGTAVGSVARAAEPAATGTAQHQSCLDALDSASTVLLAVGAEHGSIGRASNRFGDDHDLIGFLETMTAAANTLNAVIDGQQEPMAIASAGCRAGR